ncbi:MAG: TraR/DksA family transcriptional regulator [Thermodesulfobacteriota bacterium]|jgi:DnaK suppressor protein|nr:MAG: TraR/DksA family transcriptional regulator [Thermodesulfobacteriota bacterium]
MNKNEITDMLLKLKENLLQEIASNMKMEISHLQEAIADMYDLADDERERQFSILLCNRDREKLELIDEALERIEEGTYGICENCGSKIAEGRVKVMPFARYCIACQSKIEKEEKYLRNQDDSLRYRSVIKESEEIEE